MRKENHRNLGAILPDIAALNERVTLQTFTTSRDTNGAEIITWADAWTDWCRVDYSRTGNEESLTGDQFIVFTRVKFTLRYRGTINEKMRFVYDGENYDIMYKEILGQRKFETFTCENRT